MGQDHSMLVERAKRWLLNSRKCVVVATERGCWHSRESPDAIGWLRTGYSILVEVKVSVSDFRADAEKKHRKKSGMGYERWYMTPSGLLRPDLLPEGWGLLEVGGRGVKVAIDCKPRPEKWPVISAYEHPFLVSIARKAGWAGGKGVAVAEQDEPDDTLEVGTAEIRNA